MNQRRFSRELQQEQLSRKQIGERFLEFGWIPSEPSLDLGEDFIVHIYTKGVATGITFHVQAKSILNISERRSHTHLSYTLKPKDLKHWEAFSIPVVLIIWDIKQKEGRWALVSNIITELDKSRPRWRDNSKGVNARIPWDNALSDQGLAYLKSVIGRHFFPQLSSGKDLEIKFTLSFPNTPEGNKSYQAFESFRKEGTPVALKGRTIEDLRFPEWWQPWLSEYDPDSIELELGPASSRPLPATIDFINSRGEAALVPRVEFRVVQAGTESIKLTNDHQQLPLKFTIGIGKQQPSMSISSRGFGCNLNETHNTLRFLHAISTGGKLRILFSGFEDQPLVMTAGPQPDVAPDPELVELIDKLLEIQNKTGTFLRIPDQGISSKDMKPINELCDILAVGTTTAKNEALSIKIKGEVLRNMLDIHRQGKPISLRLTSETSFVELFGIRIPTGPMVRTMNGFIEMSVTELEEAIARLDLDCFLLLKLVGVTVTETFPNWTPQQTNL